APAADADRQHGRAGGGEREGRGWLELGKRGPGSRAVLDHASLRRCARPEKARKKVDPEVTARPVSGTYRERWPVPAFTPVPSRAPFRKARPGRPRGASPIPSTVLTSPWPERQLPTVVV